MTEDCQLPTTNCQLPTEDCQLPHTKNTKSLQDENLAGFLQIKKFNRIYYIKLL